MIIPVILASGSGIHRRAAPRGAGKPLALGRSLFQDTARRLGGARFAAPTVVANPSNNRKAAQQLNAFGIRDALILVEPEHQGTGPAILSAALCHEATPDALLLVAPSDHAIVDTAAFLSAVDAAAGPARRRPSRRLRGRPHAGRCRVQLPRTHPGWGTRAGPAAQGRLRKPAPRHCKALLRGRPPPPQHRDVPLPGRCRSCGLRSLRAPASHALPRGPCHRCTVDHGHLHLRAEAYRRSAPVSIDYAILELSEALQVVPIDCGWSCPAEETPLHDFVEKPAA